MQADAMVDHLIHGAVRIDPGDVNVRKLLADMKKQYTSAKRVMPRRRERRYANRKKSGAHAAKYSISRSSHFCCARTSIARPNGFR